MLRTSRAKIPVFSGDGGRKLQPPVADVTKVLLQMLRMGQLATRPSKTAIERNGFFGSKKNAKKSKLNR